MLEIGHKQLLYFTTSEKTVFRGFAQGSNRLQHAITQQETELQCRGL